jgi:hypothetical protein
MKHTTTTNNNSNQAVTGHHGGAAVRGRRLGAGLTAATIMATTVAGVVATGTASATGTAAPAPSTSEMASFVEGFLADVDLGSTGSGTGAQLAGKVDHLQPDRTYHYLQFNGGFEIDLPSVGLSQMAATGVEILPPTLKFPAGPELLVVVDPTDPFVYIGGPCPDFDRDAAKDANRRDDADQDRTGETVRKLADLVAEGSDPVQVLVDDIVGPDCGIGFSLHGNIPAEPTAGGQTFGGQVVVDGLIPMHPAVDLDGSIVARVDQHGLIATGRGDVIAKVPFVESLVDLSVPFAEAGVELEVRDSRIGIAVDGSVGIDEAYTMQLFDVPLTMPAHGGVEAAMRFGTVWNGAAWVFDPASFLKIDGDVTVGDVPLATAEIELSPRGLFVDGRARVGGLGVELGGSVTAAGIDLRGRANVEFSLDAVRQLAQSASKDVAKARNDLASIDRSIDLRRQVVRKERAANDRALARAIADVSTAERDLATIDQNIRRNNGLIGQRRTWINNEISWYNRLPWYQKPGALPGHISRLTRYNGEIAAYDAANAAQAAYRDTTRVALRAATGLVTTIRAELNRADVDDDPIITGMLATRRVTDDLLRTLQRELGKVSPSGTVQGEIEVMAGTRGFSGEISVVYCDRGRCTPLAGGTIGFGSNPVACARVFGLGEVCTRL